VDVSFDNTEGTMRNVVILSKTNNCWTEEPDVELQNQQVEKAE